MQTVSTRLAAAAIAMVMALTSFGLTTATPTDTAQVPAGNIAAPIA